MQKLKISLPLHEWLWRYEEEKEYHKFALRSSKLDFWNFISLAFYILQPLSVQNLSKNFRYDMDDNAYDFTYTQIESF